MKELRHNYVTFVIFKGKNENKKAPKKKKKKKPEEGISRRDIDYLQFF